MSRKRKTLHDYAAEFTDLVVRQHLIQHSGSGDTSAVDMLYCQACEMPLHVRRDRILQHLSSERHHCRRLCEQSGPGAPALPPRAPEPPAASPGSQRSQPPLRPPLPLILLSSACTVVPSPSGGHAPPPSGPPSVIPSATSDAPAAEAPVPSSRPRQPAAFPALRVKRLAVPSKQANPPLLSGASTAVAPGGGPRCCPKVRARACSRLGLAVFGVGSGSRALLQSLTDNSSCCLLYVVGDRLSDLQGAFSAERLSSARVVPERDAGVVLTDPSVCGVVVCSPPEAASQIVLDALRAGKGVLCEGLPALDRQTAESCFDEADRRRKPLVCGFYKRFDPAVQFLHKKVCDGRALGRLHRVCVVSSVYPAASPVLLRKSGGVFYSAAVHDVDVVSTLLGEQTPDTVFALGSALCPDVAFLKDADTVMISMKFPSGAVVSLDISQHCTRSCDQRLEVHGSQGSLWLDNQKPLGISGEGPALTLEAQTQAERYQEAYRQLFSHFLRTLQGKESPAVSRRQLLGALQVAAAAERSWQSRAAVDLRQEAVEAPGVKTEA